MSQLELKFDHGLPMERFQTHLRDRPLRGHKDARFIGSIIPDESIAIFVHGYGGDAIGTWSDFHQLLPWSREAAGCDLLFYGYDGLRADMMASASLFEAFLNDLLSRSWIVRNDNLPAELAQPASFSYRKIVLVGHSLGAVIVRRALLEAMRRRRVWLEEERIKMVLFAPAHTGASVADLAIEVLGSPLARYFVGVTRFVSPLIDQLKPGSAYLKQLAQDTSAAIAEVGPVSYLQPAQVVIAERENIVLNLPFCNDEPPDVVPGATHFTVCKPRVNFPLPLKFVLDRL